MSRRSPLLLAVLLVLVAAVLALSAVGRGCRAEPPPPATIAPTSTPVRISPTSPPTATISPSVTFAPPTATTTPDRPTMTPTARPTATATPATPQATPALLGTHVVGRGETMYGIALEWEPGRFFPWAVDVWRPVCDANPQVVDCRAIYPGDILKIPKR